MRSTGYVHFQNALVRNLNSVVEFFAQAVRSTGQDLQ